VGQGCWPAQSASVSARVSGSSRTSPRLPPTQGAVSNDKNQAEPPNEPPDHGLGRSRGGLSTKAHTLVDGHGRPLVIVVSPGQAGDSPCLPILLRQLCVGRRGPGRARTRPLLLRADKAYSSRANRARLRRRGIKAVIPEPSDQIGHRKRRGSAGGRPVRLDTRSTNRDQLPRSSLRLRACHESVDQIAPHKQLIIPQRRYRE
jgi:transposase